MKKIVSLLLVCLLLPSVLLAFTSCDALTIADVMEDPFAALTEAEKNSLSRFFDEDYGVSKYAAKALEEGSCTFSLTNRKLIGKDENFSAILYTDKDAGKSMLSLSLAKGKDRYAFDTFVDSEGIIFDSEAMFGQDGAIAIVYDTFADRISQSELVKALTLDEATLAKLKTMVETVKTSVTEEVDRVEASVNETVNTYLQLLKQEIVTEELDGEAVAVLTYTIDNEVLKLVFETALSRSSLSEEDKAALRAEVDFDEFDREKKIDIKTKVYVSLADAYVLKQSFIGTVGDLTSGEEGEIDLTSYYGEDKIALTGSVSGGDSRHTVEVAVTKTVEDKVSTYTVTVDTDIAGYASSNTPIVYTYHQKTREFSLTLDMGLSKLVAKGGITLDKKEAKIAIEEIKMGAISLEMELALIYNTDAEMPEAPEGARDLVELTEAEWEELLACAEENPLVVFFQDLLPKTESDSPFGDGEADDGFDFDFDFDFGFGS